MAKQNTVFISYRRTNSWTAQAVYQYLDAHGYDVFFDVDSIRTGDWLETILSQIRARAHFIIILTPSAVERFREPNDIMRMEIETAIDEKRNIIPLMFEGLEFSSIEYAITGKLSIIPKYNGMEIPTRFFKYAMQDLCENWLDVNVDTIIHPTPLQFVDNVDSIQYNSQTKPDITQNQLLAEKLYEEGVELHKSSNFLEAIKRFSKAIDIQPNYSDAYHKRGHSYYSLGRKNDSLKDYDEAVNIDPKHPKIHIMKATLFHELDELDVALDEANKAVESTSEFEAYLIRGFIHSSKLDYDQAISDYDQAISLDSQHAVAYANRANVKNNMGDYEGAMQDINLAIKYDPNSFIAYNGRGNIKYNLDKIDDAIEDYSRSLQINSQYLFSYINRGRAREHLEDFEGALQDYTKALKLNPTAKVYYKRGGIYFKLEKYTEAIQDFTKAIELKSDFVLAFNYRGVVKARLLDYVGALEDFQQSLVLNSEYELARKNLAIVKQKLE